MNTFGEQFRLTSFGESHGKAIGGVIDGCPYGFAIDIEELNEFISRRKTRNKLTSQRKEEDKILFLSGLTEENKTTGAPIAFIIYNRDIRSEDYQYLLNVFRPSHADFTYTKKYGLRHIEGGGRSSARETLIRCVAGGIALQILKKNKIYISAYTYSVGDISLQEPYKVFEKEFIDASPLYCPDEVLSNKMCSKIEKCIQELDSIGASVLCSITGLPVGLGEPLYDKLHARLAYAMLSINAARAFELGEGMKLSQSNGSEVNDLMSACSETKKISFSSNYSSGILGGISTGENVFFRVFFKPIPSISRKQKTCTKDFKNIELSIHGRHDPCVVPRVIPVVEAMTAITIIDFLIKRKAYLE